MKNVYFTVSLKYIISKLSNTVDFKNMFFISIRIYIALFKNTIHVSYFKNVYKHINVHNRYNMQKKTKSFKFLL